MRLPGFAAEAALGGGGGHYRSATGRAAAAGAPRILAQFKGWTPCHRDPESPTGWSHEFCHEVGRGDIECGDPVPCQPPQTCGQCECDPRTDTWSQQCCLPGGTGCTRRPCSPPVDCRIDDHRTCLPWPLDFICWGDCTRTCCHWAACDLRLCGVSPC